MFQQLVPDLKDATATSVADVPSKNVHRDRIKPAAVIHQHYICVRPTERNAFVNWMGGVNQRRTGAGSPTLSHRRTGTHRVHADQPVEAVPVGAVECGTARMKGRF